MKTKALRWGVACLLAVCLAGRADVPDQSQVITLGDGTRLTLLGTTYGSHHVAPQYEDLRTGNWIYTAPNSTVVWVKAEHDPSHWPNYELVIYDEAQTAGVISEARSRSHVKTGVDIQGFVLDAFPRWDPTTVVRARPYRGEFGAGQFVVTNPVSKTLANWTPEALPSAQSDGDLEVTLKKIAIGTNLPHWPGREATSIGSQAVQSVRLDFDWRQNGQPATNWFPWLVWTTDAVGNHASGAIRGYPPNGIYAYPPDGKLDGYFYEQGLWPNEPAWKVRLEMTRSSGFAENEIVTFTNLPVRTGTQQDADDEWTWDESKTNLAFVAQAEVNGIKMKVLPPLVTADSSQDGRKHLSVILYIDPTPRRQDMRLRLLQASNEHGRPLYTPFNPDWAGHFSVDFPDPPDIKTLNLQLALSSSRYVEFTVKPR